MLLMMCQERQISTTLIGSLRKYSAEFNQFHDSFQAQGIEVKAPTRGTPVKEINGYAIFDSEDYTAPLDIETNYLQSLLSSDFGYIVNPNGYLGAHSTAEIALARLFNIPLYSYQPVNELLDPESPNWSHFCRQIDSFDPTQPPLTMLEPYKKRRRLPKNQSDIEHLALYVLSADWQAHRGLGAIITHTELNRRRLL